MSWLEGPEAYRQARYLVARHKILRRRLEFYRGFRKALDKQEEEEADHAPEPAKRPWRAERAQRRRKRRRV